MNSNVTYEELLEMISNKKKRDSKMWSLYFLGSQVCMGDKRIYVRQGTGRNTLLKNFVNTLHWKNTLGSVSMTYQQRRDEMVRISKNVEALIKDMENTGIIEFRQLGDRSPRFPYNVKGISKEQQDKFVKMMDSDDSEMAKLAIVMLEEINKTNKNERVP